MKVSREKHVVDPYFPFVYMYRIQSNYWSAVHQQQGHFHDWHELVYVYRGTGTFFIHDHFFEMKEGDVYLVPSGTIHYGHPSQQDPYLITVLLFSPSLIYQTGLGEEYSFLELCDACSLRQLFHFFPDEQTAELLKESLSRLHQVWKSDIRNRRHKSILILHELLMLLNEMPVESTPTAVQRGLKTRQWMNEIISYIEDNMSQPITLSFLAKQALVSEEHFSRSFKKMTGLTLPQYLNTKRIAKAKELLASSNQPISFIAEKVGFLNVAHFHRSFKRITGMTPGMLRKRL